MKFLPVALLFFGYLLVYASVAKGGLFATHPWKGVKFDAYLEADKAGNIVAPGSPGVAPTPTAPAAAPAGAPPSKGGIVRPGTPPPGPRTNLAV